VKAQLESEQGLNALLLTGPGLGRESKIKMQKAKLCRPLRLCSGQALRADFNLLTGILMADYTDSHRFCFSQSGVPGNLCSESTLSPQRFAIYHKTNEMAFL
jgi:hypothetical protein